MSFYRLPTLVFVAALFSCLSVPVLAQKSDADKATGTSAQSVQKPDTDKQETPNDKDDKEKEKEKAKKKPSKLAGVVVAPLPLSSPAIGSGIIPVLGYIFPFNLKDKVSPPSTVGVAGLITDNGSRGLAVGGQLFLKENTYEITAGFVHGNVNYNIYGTGIAANLKLPLQQTGYAFLGEFLRRIGWKFFTGPRFIDGHSFITIRPNNVSNFPIPPEVGLHTNLRAIGARLTRDTRPNHFYPIGGTFFTFTSDFFSQALGSKYSFQSYRTAFNKYWSLSRGQVLAYNANFCATSGSPPSTGTAYMGPTMNCEAI